MTHTFLFIWEPDFEFSHPKYHHNDGKKIDDYDICEEGNYKSFGCISWRYPNMTGNLFFNQCLYLVCHTLPSDWFACCSEDIYSIYSAASIIALKCDTKGMGMLRPLPNSSGKHDAGVFQHRCRHKRVITFECFN